MKRRSAWLILIAGIAIADGFLKYEALNRFVLSVPRSNGAFAAFGLHKNPGILFDLPVPQPLVWTATLMLVGVLGRMAWLERTRNPLFTFGAVVTIIGAAGNFFDRLLHNFTTDYLLFFTGAAINLSDLIIIGGLLVLIHSHTLTKRKKHD